MPTPVTLDATTVLAVLKRDDIRGIWPHELNAEMALLFGEAFVARLRACGAASPVVVVGHDARAGSLELALALTRGVRGAGGEVEWIGMASTEHVYYMTGRYAERYAGGAMVTASHNPKEYNGIKFVFAGAQPLNKDDLGALRDGVIERLCMPAGIDPRAEFAEFAIGCARMRDLPLTTGARYSVVVAAGNGVGGYAFGPLARILEPWGFRFQFLDPEPDADFPRGVPNPLLPAFVRRLSRAVRAGGALLGIGFDGDADRAGFVAGDGREITASQVLALVAERKLAAGSGPAVVMRNLCGSRLLVDRLTERPGVTLVDTPVGHGKIKLLMRHAAYRECVVVAGEHSGHYFYPEFYHVDSGMLTALYMLRLVAEASAQGQRLETTLQPWRRRYAWSGEINYRFDSPDGPAAVLGALAERYAAAGGIRYEVRPDPDLGGLERVFASGAPYGLSPLKCLDLKYEFTDPDGRSGWWFVARPSGNEPALRLNVESWGHRAASRTRARVAELALLIEQGGGRRHRSAV